MNKLLLILLAFLAVFTYIRALEQVDLVEVQETSIQEAAMEIPLEIAR